MESSKKFVAEQYEANLFEGCTSYYDVEQTVTELDTEYDWQELAQCAWEYVEERLLND